MIRRLLSFSIVVLSAIWANAQLSVSKQCTINETDLSARRLNDIAPIVIDGDTIPFAIVKVGLVEPNALFDSRWVLKQEFKDNEYIVYCMEGLKSITIKTPRFTPLHCKFPQPLKARCTYTMEIARPDGAKYNGNLHIRSNVPDADVYVDGRKVSDGTPFTYTGEAGRHLIELKADGFNSQSRQIDIPMAQEKYVTINLFAAGSLSIDGVDYGMVPIGATSFAMGSPEFYYTRPVRSVSLRPFSVGSTLVSVDLWQKIMGEADPKIIGENGQVVNVSYDEIQVFIDALNAKTGNEFRLPSEAEWEYLALNASIVGLSDMFSSLEWCNDWFGRYSLQETTNPSGPTSGILRSVRGGSEFTDTDPVYSMPAYRWRKAPNLASPKISFRLVQDN